MFGANNPHETLSRHHFRGSFEVGAKIFQSSGQLFGSVDLWIFLHWPTHFLGQVRSASMTRLISAPGAYFFFPRSTSLHLQAPEASSKEISETFSCPRVAFIYSQWHAMSLLAHHL